MSVLALELDNDVKEEDEGDWTSIASSPSWLLLPSQSSGCLDSQFSFLLGLYGGEWISSLPLNKI